METRATCGFPQDDCLRSCLHFLTNQDFAAFRPREYGFSSAHEENGVLVSSLLSNPTVGRRFLISFAGLIASLTLFIYFWGDLCRWRSLVKLSERDHSAAARWIQRSMWFSSNPAPGTYLLQLKIARRTGDFREVERLLHEASKAGVPRKEIQRERWLAMAQTNQFEAMQSHWDELLKDARDDEPEIARAHYAWAMLYHNHDLAKWTLELWHEDYPQDPEPLVLLGRYCQSMFNWEGAEKAYRDALAIAPNNDECQMLLAKALQVRLNTTEAIPLFENYLRRHPDDLTAVRGLAESLATRGDYAEAIRIFQEALQKDPNDALLQKSYGELLLSSGDAVAAVAVLEKAHHTIPEHANLANSFAKALKACGRSSEAEPLFAFVAESQPKLVEMANLEKQLRDQPGNLELRMKIAAIVAKFVSRRDAIRWYENLLSVAPKYKPAHQELADLYRALGEEKLARLHLLELEQESR